MSEETSTSLNQSDQSRAALGSLLGYKVRPLCPRVHFPFPQHFLFGPYSYHFSRITGREKVSKQSLEHLPFSSLTFLKASAFVCIFGALANLKENGQRRTGQPGSSCHGDSWVGPLRWLRVKRRSTPRLRVLASCPIFWENRDPQNRQWEDIS